MEQEASIHPFPARPGQSLNGQSLNGKAAGQKSGQGLAVYFSRQELSKLLNVYGYRVAEGEWRDYALDMLEGMAVFSIFRRTSEAPIYRIIKEPALAQRQGMWRIVGPGGQILKRGSDLEKLMRFFDRKKDGQRNLALA